MPTKPETVALFVDGEVLSLEAPPWWEAVKNAIYPEVGDNLRAEITLGPQDTGQQVLVFALDKIGVEGASGYCAEFWGPSIAHAVMWLRDDAELIDFLTSGRPQAWCSLPMGEERSPGELLTILTTLALGLARHGLHPGILDTGQHPIDLAREDEEMRRRRWEARIATKKGDA